MDTRGILESDLRSDGMLLINITGDEVWMTRWEITEFLGITTQSFIANLRVIFKNGELKEERVCCENCKGTVYYNLEVIIALIFRCKGAYCQAIRDWIKYRIQKPIMKHRNTLILAIPQGGTLS